MKAQFKKRRFLPAALAILVLVVGSGVAYAYWTASGAGTGTGSTAAGVTTLTASSASLNAMYPGDTAQNIVITVHNPSTQTVYVTSVSAAVTSTTNAGCTATDFTVASNPVAVSRQILAGGNLILDGTAVPPIAPPTIQFNNKPAVNQDACKSVTVNLGFTIS
jgi:hypothetical protein